MRPTHHHSSVPSRSRPWRNGEKWGEMGNVHPDATTIPPLSPCLARFFSLHATPCSYPLPSYCVSPTKRIPEWPPPPIPLPRDINPLPVPLMSFQAPPSESLVAALHPLIVCVLLFYLLPALFSDHTAQAVWETYHLHTLIAHC